MEKNVIWNDFKSNHIISNQIQIKSHVFQIKSLCVIQSWFKSNHDMDLPITAHSGLFTHILNRR